MRTVVTREMVARCARLCGTADHTLSMCRPAVVHLPLRLGVTVPYVTELELLEALRRGDERAFRELVDRHAASMLRRARVYVRDRSVAEEVVQEAWLGVLRGIERFEGRSSLKTWLLRIVANLAKTRAVREARSVPFSALLPDDAEEAGPSVPESASAAPTTAGRGTGRPRTCQELVEVVTDYLEGEMPAERRLLFEEHIAWCDWCQTYVEQMRETIRLTGTLREEDIEPEARDALLALFHDWKSS